MPRKPRRKDDADNLHGYPPRPPVPCPGPCGRLAEPFAGDYCWSCAQALSLATEPPKRHLPNGAGRKPREAKLPRTISPVYTPVTMGGR